MTLATDPVSAPLNLIGLIETYVPELEAIRRDLHRHPEIGFEEVRTSGIVAEKLASRGIEAHRGCGGGRRPRGAGRDAVRPAGGKPPEGDVIRKPVFKTRERKHAWI